MRLATENTVVQRENPAITTRVLDKGTKINMYFEDTVIPGTLNDSETMAIRSISGRQTVSWKESAN